MAVSRSNSFRITVNAEVSTYTATHYVAPFAVVGASSDEDPQNATAFVAATNPSTPCTLMCAIENADASGGTGVYVQVAPGDYVSLATQEYSANFTGRFHVAGNGYDANNPLVFFAQYPAASYYGSPALLSKLVQPLGATGSPGPAVGCDPFFLVAGRNHVILDGFHADTASITPSEEEGIIGITSGSTNCGIRRCWIKMDDFNAATGENRSCVFLNNAHSCHIRDCRFTGNGSNTQHNSASIETRWTGSCIIEHNYFDGVTGPWMKGANWGPFVDYDDPNAQNLDFSNGSTRVSAGDVVVDATTGASGTALFDGMKAHGISEDYGTGDAHGYLVLTNLSGTFGAGNNIQVSGVTVATAATGNSYNGGYYRSRHCIVRCNMVLNAPVFAFRVMDNESVDIHQNVFHSVDSGVIYKNVNANDWNQIPFTYSIYNNLMIGTGSFGYVLSSDGGLAAFDGIRIADDSAFHSNILVDDGAAGVFGFKTYPDPIGQIGAWGIYDRNVYFARAGSVYFNLDYDSDSSPSYTGVSDWQTYAAGYGTQPGQPGVNYEANSVDTDPEFVDGNYADVASGDWRLANNGQVARAIGLSSVNGGVCGPYITGDEEIGIRTP